MAESINCSLQRIDNERAVFAKEALIRKIVQHHVAIDMIAGIDVDRHFQAAIGA